MTLVAFTRPNGTKIWFNPDHVHAVRQAGDYGDHVNAKTVIIHYGGAAGVLEEVSQVIQHLSS